MVLKPEAYPKAPLPMMPILAPEKIMSGVDLKAKPPRPSAYNPYIIPCNKNLPCWNESQLVNEVFGVHSK
jgi:hypothetical protein